MFASNDLSSETAFALAGLSHWPMPCVPKFCVLAQMMFGVYIANQYGVVFYILRSVVCIR